MFRRSRFSIRPNVSTAGRTAATPQEAPSVNQEASETPKDTSESSTTAATDNKSDVTPSEKPTAPGDGNDQNGEGTSSTAAVQRRKRFAIKPKVAPGRPSSLARTPKSPVKVVSETPVAVSDLDKPTTSGQTAITAAPQGLQSPRRRRLSEENKQPKVQPKPALIPSDSSGPSAVPPADDPQEQAHLLTDSGRQLESTSGDQVKEVPSKFLDKVPPSLPDKEAIEISEKAKTLVSSKSGRSLSPPAFSLSRLLNDPSDLQRLEKARKLRELLRREMHKEKKIKKAKARAKEFTLDPAKMTMRDLIRYLPVSNPMISSLEDPAPENETVVPPSPGREESPERAQEPEVPPKIASPREEEEEEEAAAAEEEQEEALMVPQVKVAEDGSLIIDEESLTVEVQRAKGPNLIQDRDPIFERGSTTTYSSFRKGTYSKPWSSEETDMFFLAISMVGTDFSMICQLFPHRARSEIKNKFKKEERENAWRIDKAFRERRKLDIEYFSKLLEKILEVQKNRKKLKSIAEKNSPKKHKRKAKGKKAARKLSDVEEEDEEEENKIPDLEVEEGEKENEDLCNEGGTTVSKPKKKCKRKNKQDASNEEPNNKKNKTGEKSSEQDEAYIPEDTEAALPEDGTNSDMTEKTDDVDAAKDTAIKPAKLSRGRAPKPLLPLGRKWGKKPPPPSTKAKDTATEKGDEGVSDEASKEQIDEDASPIRQANKRKSANDEISSEEDEATLQPPRPTRYGRVPKPTKPLTYPAKDDEQSSASETIAASPAESTAAAAKPKPKGPAKRGRSSKPQSAQESKKPKLITLRASQSEYSDEENEKQEEEEVEEEQHPACSSSKDSTAPAFVPASLRSPHPVISEVEETMEELDILANMPDVLGISKDALCPDASFELTQNETGTAEPCEHQLDLLVDVIDFLSTEHTEASDDESYNEAAQTLLTIGNLTHISHSAQNQIALQDLSVTGATSVSEDETCQHIEVEIVSNPVAQEENSATPLMSTTSDQVVTEEQDQETSATVEPQNSTTDNSDLPIIETSDQRTGADMDPTPPLPSSPEKSKKNSPQTGRGRLSKVKPKPNLGHASRTAQSRSKPDASIVRTSKDTVPPDCSQATKTAVKEAPKIADCNQNLSKDEIPCTEVNLAGEPSGSQGRSVCHVKSSALTLAQSTSESQIHCFTGTQFEHSLEQTTRDSTRESTAEILMSHVGKTRGNSNNVVTSDTADVQEANIDSDLVQRSSDCPVPCVTPVEDLTVCQKEESNERSTRQTRKSRFQEVGPKPNLAQTSRTAVSKSLTTKDIAEKESNPTPSPKFHEKTVIEIEKEPTCSTSPEKTGTCPVSDLPPSMDLGSAFASREEMSTTEEKKSDFGVVGQVESGAAASAQSASEIRHTSPTPDSTEEKLMSLETESSCSNLLASDSAVQESQVGQRSKIDSAPVQESSNNPALCVTPVENLPASQKEDSEDASTCQTRKSRFQKVKPKPNLAQTSRTVQSKPQTTKDTAEKDSSATPNPKFHEKTMIEVEAEPICTASYEEPSQSTGPASDLLPLLDLGSILTPAEEVSDFGVVGQVESGAATIDQSASENQNTRQTSESAEGKLMSNVGTIEGSCSKSLASDSAVPESEVGQGSNIDLAPIQESSGHPAPCVKPVEDLPTSQKEESEDASIRQARKSRFQKVKPKPNLTKALRTVQSKPSITEDTAEKDSSATPNPKFHEETIIEVEAEPTCTTPPEKTSQSTGPASDLIPSLDLGSTLTPTKEVSTTEEKKTDVGVVGQVESGAATSDQSASGNQNFSDTQFEPCMEQATRDTRPPSESTEGKLMSHVGTAESSRNNPPTSDSAVPESQVGQMSDIGSDPIQEGNDHPPPSVTHVEELSVSQKAESKVTSTFQTRRSRLQKVKPKPNLPQTSRSVRSKPQTTENLVTQMQLVEKPSSPTSKPESTDNTIPEVEAQPTCSTSLSGKSTQIESANTASFSVPSLELYSTHEPTGELASTESQKTDVQNAQNSGSEDSGKNVPQRKCRFPKVKPKPNLRSSPRTTQKKLQPNDISKPLKLCHMDTSSNVTLEQQSVDNNDAQAQLKLAEKDSKRLTSTHCSLYTELGSTKLDPAESEKSLDSTSDKSMSSDGIFIASSSVIENQSRLTHSVLENKSSEKSTVEGESTGNEVEIGPASQCDRKQVMSVTATETNTQTTADPTSISDVQFAEDRSTESKIKSVETQSTPDPTESTQKPSTENDSEALNPDAVQQCSETTETVQTAAQSTNDNELESTDSSKSSRKAPQTRRGRLVKPKPNLGRRSQPPKPQQVQNLKQAEADSGTCSEGVVALVSHKPESEIQHDIQEPVEGAIEQQSNHNYPPDDAGSSLGCLSQVIEELNQHDSPLNVAGPTLGCVPQEPDNSTQDASTSSTGGIPSHPGLTMFPDMLLEQVPSDPDEPFFILSLTEIPVSSSGEMVDSSSEPLPYFPVTDASVQQQSSVPGEAAAGEGPFSDVAVTVSVDESSETGLNNVNRGSGMENPVDAHESAAVQPSMLPLIKPAKLQVKPNTPGKKQACKIFAADEAESIPTLDSELPGPSLQPKAFDGVVTEPQKGSGDYVEVEKETVTGGKDAVGHSSGAPTIQTTRTSARNRSDRKPKDFPSFLSETNNTAPSSDSPPDKAASTGPKVGTQRAAVERPTPSPAASTSHYDAPTPGPTQPPEETRSPPSTASQTQAQGDVEQTSVHGRLRSDPTPGTSPLTAEVSSCRQSDCAESSSPEEEPTSVSQYFLSDIFTEVEEG